ncbi:MAG: hypothetical protein WC248_05475 [Candidatus Methanomethylophilaceae archaeon]|jgi:hypothetical protein
MENENKELPPRARLGKFIARELGFYISNLQSDEVSQEFFLKAWDALIARDALSPCPRCGKRRFSLGFGFSRSTLDISIEGKVLSKVEIPTVILVCDNCGFISEHSMERLGLLEEENSDDKRPKDDKRR